MIENNDNQQKSLFGQSESKLINSEPADTKPEAAANDNTQSIDNTANKDFNSNFVNRPTDNWISEQNKFNDLRENYNTLVEESKTYKEQVKLLQQAVEELKQIKQPVQQQQQQTNSQFNAEEFKKQILSDVKKEYDDSLKHQRLNQQVAMTAQELSGKYPNISENFFAKFIDHVNETYGKEFIWNMKLDAVKPTLNMLFDNYYQTNIRTKDGVTNSLNVNPNTNSNVPLNVLNNQQNREIELEARKHWIRNFYQGTKTKEQINKIIEEYVK